MVERATPEEAKRFDKILIQRLNPAFNKIRYKGKRNGKDDHD